MAKFFDKEYAHAYKRGKTVWVQGSITGHHFHRMSTGKKFTKANMNRAEKTWDTLLMDHFKSKQDAHQRDAMLSLDEYAKASFGQQEANRRFYTTS